MPLQAPDQPANMESGEGKGRSVSTVPTWCRVEQVCGEPGVFAQSPSGGLTCTVPLPCSRLSTVSVSVCGPRKTAIATRASSIVTWQGPLPLQAPDQPANTESGEGKGVSVSGVPTRCRVEHVCGEPGVFAQSASGGLTCTVPLPCSRLSTVSISVCGPRKTAIATRAASIVTWQGPLPLQAPDQPANTESGEGKGVSVSGVPTWCRVEHVCGEPGVFAQSASGGLTCTVPLPCSRLSTVSISVCGPRKTAIATRAASIVTWQGPLPLQAPDQPANTESGEGRGVSVSGVPTWCRVEHVCGEPGVFAQSASGGLTCTVPLPCSRLSTVSISVCGPRKAAPTARLLETVTLQVGCVPLQAPLQPAKTESGAGAAVSVTTVPAS